MRLWHRQGSVIIAVALAALAISLWVWQHRSIARLTETMLAAEREFQSQADAFQRINRQDFEAMRSALMVANQGLRRQEEQLHRLNQQYSELATQSAVIGTDGRHGIAVMACHQIADGWRQIRQAETQVKSVKDDIANFLDILKTAEAGPLGELSAEAGKCCEHKLKINLHTQAAEE
jgi:hypothetical protein